MPQSLATPGPLPAEGRLLNRLRARVRPKQSRGTVRHGLLGSVRFRILAVMLAMMAASMSIIGGVLATVQLAAVNDRVETNLTQEVRELEQFGRGLPSEGVPPYDDPVELIADFMRQAVPGPNEAMAAMEDGQIAFVSQANQFDIDRPEIAAVARDTAEPGRAVMSQLVVDGTTLRMITAAVDVAEARTSTTYHFLVVIDIGRERHEIQQSMLSYAGLSLGALVVAAVVGYLIAGRLMRPLVELREATDSIDSADLGRRVRVREPDNDVAQLAVNFNQMLDRLETGFADQRQFLDDAAHELRTPLTILRGNLETMDAEDPADVRQVRALGVDEVDRMDRLVSDLLLLAKSRRPDFLHWEQVEVDDLAAEAFNRVQVLGQRDWQLGEPIGGSIVADRQRLLQAMAQLCANAVKYSNPGDTVLLAMTWETDRSLGKHLVIRVSDTGLGIDEHRVQRIFERFQRAAADGVDGLGLGLAIVRAIAIGHEGSVTVESEVGKGSSFDMRIPVGGS